MPGRFFDRLRGRHGAPLEGAPAVRRQKTYSAQSGYVYQYTYEGRRRQAGRTEYVFQVTADRKTFFEVPVTLADDVISAWEQAHDFTLRPNELHGIAKVALFQAFDDRAGPGQMREAVLVRGADLAMIVETLGII